MSKDKEVLTVTPEETEHVDRKISKEKNGLTVNLGDKDLVEYIVSRATEEVNTRAVHRESRWQQNLSIVLVILGLVGVSGIVALGKS